MKIRKTCIALIALSCSLSVFAQRGDELLVYAVKGHVTAVYKSIETPVRIGKVLLPGTVIKADKDAALTMLCTKGKPFHIMGAGSYAVAKWKDSCRIQQSSITSNYFKYIWDQLYAYSPEHKEEMRRRNDMAVSRGNEPDTEGKSLTFNKLTFGKGMDTVNYDGTDFPLSWSGTGFKGFYHFTLYESKGRVVIYKDSTRNSFITIESFKKLLKPGKTYRWTVYAKGAQVSRKRVLNYVPAGETAKMTNIFLQPSVMPEDTATTSFRVAYMLEQKHFLAEALQWYQKANEQDPDMELFRDQLIRFMNEYWVR